MQDRQIRFTFMGALATITGVIAFGLAIACFVFDSHPIGLLGIHFAIGSALFRVRSWLCILADREQNAFELGRDSVQASERVRSLR